MFKDYMGGIVRGYLYLILEDEDRVKDLLGKNSFNLYFRWYLFVCILSPLPPLAEANLQVQ